VFTKSSFNLFRFLYKLIKLTLGDIFLSILINTLCNKDSILIINWWTVCAHCLWLTWKEFVSVFPIVTKTVFGSMQHWILVSGIPKVLNDLKHQIPYFDIHLLFSWSRIYHISVMYFVITNWRSSWDNWSIMILKSIYQYCYWEK